ncbi:hypothetical protein BVIET440_100108 [Burkholderia vietnamiensis]|nr:hypothetical protein BVI2075_180111 [Burkholderia vietnamiensis]CAG9224945.1 hypothetical protein BVI1335_530091 [Burkholderia vietnamiensis]
MPSRIAHEEGLSTAHLPFRRDAARRPVMPGINPADSPFTEDDLRRFDKEAVSQPQMGLRIFI